MGCCSRRSKYVPCFPIGPSSRHGNLLARRNIKIYDLRSLFPFFLDVATGLEDDFWQLRTALTLEPNRSYHVSAVIRNKRAMCSDTARWGPGY